MTDAIPPSPRPGQPDGLQLWGGHECTINRVGDRWFDQTPRSGHDRRLGDLALFAELGISALRYPCLWERVSPDDPEQADFGWYDERFAELRRIRLRPIVTLTHHGSGPSYTSLLQDSFAPGRARHAGEVASRYPWITDWTPVNEPLTTSRFSALYGYWYPHTTDETAFITALLNQIDATRLSMRAIRSVNPAARLIQTDDLGFCHATTPLQPEAEFQNARRWLGWDLLCGMVAPGHALWERLVALGFEGRLRMIADDPCPPDLIGVNHYLSSERLLDHRVERHPDRAVADRELGRHGGVPYVDVDAVRNLREGVVGLPALLRQTWERYGIPLAVTECHNGATREEQVRWFVEVWRGCQALRDEGVDVRAVTAWSLLGSFDWNRMVTRSVGHYEPGVCDVRTGEPRPTMMARVLQDLASGREPRAVGLDRPGWWRRPSRLGEAAEPWLSGGITGERESLDGGAPLVVVGDRGPLSELIVRACESRGLSYVQMADPAKRQLRTLAPWAVIDARDWAGVCDAPPISAGQDAVLEGWFTPPEALARTCAELAVPCAVFSASAGFEEVDERLLALGGPKLLLARTETVFTPWDRSRYAIRLLDTLEAGLQVRVDPNAPWEEAYGPDLIDVVLDLMMDGVAGPLDFRPYEAWSRADFADRLAEIAECDADLVVRSAHPARSPLRVGGTQAPASLLPPGETTLERLVRESRAARRAGLAIVTRRDDEPHMQTVET